MGDWVVGWLGGWVLGWLGGWVVRLHGWVGGWVCVAAVHDKKLIELERRAVTDVVVCCGKMLHSRLLACRPVKVQRLCIHRVRAGAAA